MQDTLIGCGHCKHSLVECQPVSDRTGGGRPEAVGHGPPNRSRKSMGAAVQFAATRRLNPLRLDTCNGGQRSRSPAVRCCGRRPAYRARSEHRSDAPVHLGLGVRHVHPHGCRRWSLCGCARAPAAARLPPCCNWRQRPRASAMTSVRSTLPPKIGA